MWGVKEVRGRENVSPDSRHHNLARDPTATTSDLEQVPCARKQADVGKKKIHHPDRHQSRDGLMSYQEI